MRRAETRRGLVDGGVEDGFIMVMVVVSLVVAAEVRRTEDDRICFSGCACRYGGDFRAPGFVDVEERCKTAPLDERRNAKPVRMLAGGIRQTSPAVGGKIARASRYWSCWPKSTGQKKNSRIQALSKWRRTSHLLKDRCIRRFVRETHDIGWNPLRTTGIVMHTHT